MSRTLPNPVGVAPGGDDDWGQDDPIIAPAVSAPAPAPARNPLPVARMPTTTAPAPAAAVVLDDDWGANDPVISAPIPQAVQPAVAAPSLRAVAPAPAGEDEWGANDPVLSSADADGWGAGDPVIDQPARSAEPMWRQLALRQINAQPGLSPTQQRAILDRFQQQGQIIGEPTIDPVAIARTAVDTPLQQAAQAFTGNLANTGAMVQGITDPDAAERIQRQNAVRYAHDPESLAAGAGDIAAEVVKTVPTILNAPLGLAALSAPVVGGQRVKADQRREAGHDVSGMAEGASIAGAVGVEAATEFAFLKLAKRLGGPIARRVIDLMRRGDTPGAKALLKDATKLVAGGAAGGFVEEAGAEIGTEGTDRLTIGSDRTLGQVARDAHTAGKTGAAVGGILGGVGAVAGATDPRATDRAYRPQIEEEEAALDQLEQQLARQQPTREVTPPPQGQQQELTQTPPNARRDTRAEDEALVAEENRLVDERLSQQRQRTLLEEELAPLRAEDARARELAGERQEFEQEDAEAASRAAARQRLPVNSEDELRRMPLVQLRATAEREGVAFDTRSLTIPRVLDAQHIRRLEGLSDSDLYRAVKDEGLRAGNRERNIGILTALSRYGRPEQQQPAQRLSPQPPPVEPAPTQPKLAAPAPAVLVQDETDWGMGDEVIAPAQPGRTEGPPAPVPVAPQPTGFRTSQGSSYTWDGTASQRTKTPHAGHDPRDVGLKPKSARTVFVAPEVAQRVGMHGQLNREAQPRVLIEGDQVVLTRRFGPGYSKTHRQAFPFTTQPEVGKAPVELWASGSFQPGNPIVELVNTLAPDRFEGMKTAELFKLARDQGVAIEGNKTRESILAALRTAAARPAPAPAESRGAQGPGLSTTPNTVPPGGLSTSPGQTSAIDTAPTAGQQQSPNSVSPTRTPGKRKAPGPFTKTGIANHLIQTFQEQSGITDEVNTTYDELADFGDASAFVFPRSNTKTGFPGEIERMLEGRPGLVAQGIIRLARPGETASGPDALSKLGDDRYEQILDEQLVGNTTKAVAWAEKNGDPHTRILAALWRNYPRREDRVKTEKHDAKADPIGTTFEMQGAHFEIIEGPDGERLLRDGEDYPIVPVDALSELPIDKGTLKVPASENADDNTLPAIEGDPFGDLEPAQSESTDVPNTDTFAPPPAFFDADAAGATTARPGLFGQQTVDRNTGEQQSFLDTSKPAEPERFGSKSANDPRNTGQMFGKGGTVPPEPEGTGPAGSPSAPARTPRETITAAAWRFPDGRVIAGATHGEALEAAGIDFETFIDESKEFDGEDGFLTSTGRFVDRKEAAEIAKAAHGIRSPSLPEGQLSAHDMPEEWSDRAPVGRAHSPAAAAPSNALAQPRTMAGSGRVEVTAPAIIKKTEQITGTPIRYGHGHFAARRAAGWFMRQTDLIRQREAEKLDVAAHEAGHAIHEKIVGWNTPWPAGVAAEMERMGKELYGKRKPTAGYKREGFAEYVARFLLGDDMTAAAPQTHQWFRDTVLPAHADFARGFDELTEMFRAWDRQGAVARVQSKINRIERGVVPAIKNGWDRIRWLFSRQAWTNDAAPLEDAEEALLEQSAAQGVTIPPSMSPSQIRRALKGGAPGTARHFIFEAAVSRTGTVVGPSLRQVIEPVADRIADFSAYAYARRAMLLHDRGLNPGISRADAEHTLRELETPAFRAASDGITRWADHLLDYVIDAGGLSREAAKTIRDLNPIYLPLQRYFEDTDLGGPRGGGGGRGVVNQGSPVKRLKGSGRSIVDPFEALVRQAETIILSANKARIARAVVTLAENVEGSGWFANKVEAPREATSFSMKDLKRQLEDAGVDLDNADLDAMLTVFTQATRYTGKQNIVSVWRNGEHEFWELDPDVYRVVTEMDKDHIPAQLRFLSGPSRLVRLGATGVSAPFALANFVRDAITQAVYSRSTTRTPLASFAGLWSRIRGNPDAVRFDALGVGMATMFGQDRAAAAKNARDLEQLASRGHTLHTVSHPIQALRGILEAVESAPRTVEFRKVLEQAEKKWGKGSESAVIEAMIAAKDVTTDFTRAGILSAMVNQFYPFFNARVQGASKFYRSFVGDPASGSKRMAIKASVAGFLYITTPSLLLWWLNRDEEWWKELPAHERHNNWHFSIDGGRNIYRVPVPFELGKVFGVVPVAAVDAAYRKEPQVVSDALWDMLGSFLPINTLGGIIPAYAKPATEAAFNFNDFRDRPIVSPFEEQQKLPQDQYRQWTTETAKAVGKLLGVSPMKVEHVLSGYTGGLGLDVARAAENIVGVKEGDDDRGIVGRVVGAVADPIGRRFTSRNPLDDGGARSVQQAYDRQRVLQQRKGSGVATDDEVRELDRLNGALRQMREARDSETMTDEQQSRRILNEARGALGRPTIDFGDPATAVDPEDPRTAARRDRGRQADRIRAGLDAKIQGMLSEKNRLDYLGVRNLTPDERRRHVRLRAIESLYGKLLKAERAGNRERAARVRELMEQQAQKLETAPASASP